jgi:hypothetical protein
MKKESLPARRLSDLHAAGNPSGGFGRHDA